MKDEALLRVLFDLVNEALGDKIEFEDMDDEEMERLKRYAAKCHDAIVNGGTFS